MATLSARYRIGNFVGLCRSLQRTQFHTSLATHKHGAGGRSSDSGLTVTVFGATGFLGRYLVNCLGRMGSQIIVPHRGDEYYCKHLKVMGDLGQIHLRPYSPKDPESIYNVVKHSNVVVNLIGRDYVTRNFTFHDAHVKVAQMVANAANTAGITNFVHVSALNADPNSPSLYLKSKFEGEEAVRAICPSAVMVRPANMMGDEDRYLNYFAYLVRTTRFTPVLGQSFHAYKRPVYVMDVARAITNIIMDPQSAGRTYEMTGPQRLNVVELINYVQQVTFRPLYVIRMPLFAYRFVAYMFELNPFFPKLTRDLLIRHHITDVINEDIPGLEDLGITTTPIERVAIKVLRRHRRPDDLYKTIDDVGPRIRSA